MVIWRVVCIPKRRNSRDSDRILLNRKDQYVSINCKLRIRDEVGYLRLRWLSDLVTDLGFHCIFADDWKLNLSLRPPPPVEMQIIVKRMSLRMYVCVRLSAILSKTTRPKFTRFSTDVATAVCLRHGMYFRFCE